MTRARTHRQLEIVALVAATVLQVAVFVRLTPELGSPVLVAIAAIVGYALADLLTGAAHWLGDNVGDESWPIVGAHFIRPFRQHHIDPQDITRHDFIETNGNNAILAIAPLAILTWCAPAAPYLVMGLATTVFAFAATNQIHSWSHADRVPRVVRWLQGAGLILRPQDHARHHVAPFASAYCVTTGWMNPVLDRLTGRRRPEVI